MGKIYTHDNGKRADFHVENDSGALSVVSTDATADIVADDRSNDEKFVNAHKAFLLSMPGDASFNARLVLGGTLNQEEQDQWLARQSAKLVVGQDGILICGGFDPRFLEEWETQVAEQEASIYKFNVPAGEYLIDIYTYFGHWSAAGQVMEEQWPERFGQWFRKSHPGQPFPAWIAYKLRECPDMDPGHEREWENLEKSIKSGLIKVERDAFPVVDYIFHVQKSHRAAQFSELPEGGWFDYSDGSRVPPICPTGLKYMGPDDEVDSFISEITQ
ncbi:MAG: hypothetical protein OEV92_03560 [Nitrospinota bacterium]|nr:hypothetical protein [Nitrospinota bacterium]